MAVFVVNECCQWQFLLSMSSISRVKQRLQTFLFKQEFGAKLSEVCGPFNTPVRLDAKGHPSVREGI